MKFEQIKDRQKLAAYFQNNLPLHAYSLGDLDDFFWPRTTYYGIKTSQGVDRVVLIYRGTRQPILLALGNHDLLEGALFNQLAELLPNQVYAHLSPGLEKRFSQIFTLQNFGSHYKMSLTHPNRMREISGRGTVQLTTEDLPEIKQLFRVSYPGNSFDSRLILTGKYYGFREGSKLVSIAGVHIYSARYRVAALGNITTHPGYRNRGLGTLVTARVCRELDPSVDYIGLNVKCSNRPAVQLYKDLGFKIHSKYGEFSLKRGV